MQIGIDEHTVRFFFIVGNILTANTRFDKFRIVFVLSLIHI